MQTIHPTPEDMRPDSLDDNALFDELLDIDDRRRVFLRMVFGVEVDRTMIDTIFDPRVED